MEVVEQHQSDMGCPVGTEEPEAAVVEDSDPRTAQDALSRLFEYHCTFRSTGRAYEVV